MSWCTFAIAAIMISHLQTHPIQRYIHLDHPSPELVWMPSPTSLKPSLVSSSMSCTRSRTRSVSRFVPSRDIWFDRRDILVVSSKSLGRKRLGEPLELRVISIDRIILPPCCRRLRLERRQAIERHGGGCVTLPYGDGVFVRSHWQYIMRRTEEAAQEGDNESAWEAGAMRHSHHCPG